MSFTSSAACAALASRWRSPTRAAPVFLRESEPGVGWWVSAIAVLRLPESAGNQPETSANENGFHSLPVPRARALGRRRNTASVEGAATWARAAPAAKATRQAGYVLVKPKRRPR